MLLNGYLGQLGRTLDCGNRDATKGWKDWLFFFSQYHPEKERSLAQPLLLLPPASSEINDPAAAMPEAFPLAFVVYFAGKKKKRVGGVRLMRWVWVISHSNHRHWQWQDLSACVIVHCLSLKFSACIMFLKIHHGNIKDLMQCFV